MSLRDRKAAGLSGVFVQPEGHEPQGTAKMRGGAYARHALEQTTYELKERVKELNCLYSISSVVEEPGISLQEILQRTVDLLPPAWQYPEITCSRIVVGDQAFRTDNFRQTPWRQSQPIVLRCAAAGVLEIYYLEERPQADEGPFLKEERSLIKVIAERIGGIMQRKEAETALKESEAHNRALLNAIPDLMFQVDRQGKLLGFREGKFDEYRPLFSRLVGKNVHDLAREERMLPKRLVEQVMLHVSRAFTTGRTQVFEQHVAFGDVDGDFEVRVVVSQENEALGIVRDTTQRKRLEREILEISGREQRRIGQDLHDSLCQHLAGIGFMTKVLERKLAAGAPVESADAAELVSLLDEAITLTRGYARGLNPVRLDEGLMAALGELAANTERLFGVRCLFEHDEPVHVGSEDVATHVYRIMQEALNNAIKHGKADLISVSFHTAKNVHSLTIRDNGTGLPAASSRGKGMGLNIMRYRASMIGGSLDIRNDEDRGAVLVCSFPARAIPDWGRDRWDKTAL